MQVWILNQSSQEVIRVCQVNPDKKKTMKKCQLSRLTALSTNVRKRSNKLWTLRDVS